MLVLGLSSIAFNSLLIFIFGHDEDSGYFSSFFSSSDSSTIEEKSPMSAIKRTESVHSNHTAVGDVVVDFSDNAPLITDHSVNSFERQLKVQTYRPLERSSIDSVDITTATDFNNLTLPRSSVDVAAAYSKADYYSSSGSKDKEEKQTSIDFGGNHPSKADDSKTQKNDLNIRAAMLHTIGDLLCSISVVLSSLVLMASPTSLWIDPTCTFIFAAIATLTTLPVIKDIASILMLSPPVDCTEIERELSRIGGVESVSVRVWMLTMEEWVGDVRIVAQYDNREIVQVVKEVMARWGVADTTVEVNLARL